jgi:hypothetical protein
MLRNAAVIVDPAARTWTSSAGLVRGHHVRLRVDAGALGLVRAVPSVLDTLHAAFTRAVARDPGACLVELTLVWNGTTRSEAEGYRGAAPRVATLRDALVAYFEGASMHDVAEACGVLALTTTGRDVAVHAPDAAASIEGPVCDALRVILGVDVKVSWRT